MINLYEKFDKDGKRIIIDENGIIFDKKMDNRGSCPKLWIVERKNPLSSYMVKFDRFNPRNSLHGELIGEIVYNEICHFLNFKHTQYYLGMLYAIDETPKYCVISPNYRDKKYNFEMSGKSLMQRFDLYNIDNREGLVTNMPLNTIYSYIYALQAIFPTLSSKKLKEMKFDLLCIAELDFLTMQIDRNNTNVGFMGIEKKGPESLIVIPSFDNACCFMLVSSKLNNKIEHIDSAGNIPTAIVEWSKKKKSGPLLGIKTSMITTGKYGEFINNTTQKDIDIFINELAFEIKENPELLKFHKKLCELKIDNVIDDLQEPLILPEMKILVKSLFKSRLSMLNSALLKEKVDENNTRI